MAKTATLYRFQIELADIDRNVYESLDLRVACHPSEDSERLVIRVLARAIAHEEGLEFGRGLSNAEDAALWAKSLHGSIETWIDVGCPSAERLHRASKAADRVSVFTSKGGAMLRKEWLSQPIHRASELEVIRIPAAFAQQLATRLQRNMQWYLTLQEGALSVADGKDNFDTTLERTTVHSLTSED
ncbi:MAG: YaeQ family protein [Myxococcales bacterium]|nr:YaeQ family protein [Myxococcales bacterium]